MTDALAVTVAISSSTWTNDVGFGSRIKHRDQRVASTQPSESYLAADEAGRAGICIAHFERRAIGSRNDHGSEGSAEGADTLADRNTMEFESPQDRPIDASPGKRPGVPIKAEPSPAEGAHWAQAESRPSNDDHSDHEVVCLATRVTGTAQPLRGLSGMLRQRAYRISDHRAKHWALLMSADRLDVVENRLGSILGTPLRVAGLERLGGRVERNPIGAVSVLILAILLLIRKAL